MQNSYSFSHCFKLYEKCIIFFNFANFLLQNAQPIIYHVIIFLQLLNATVCENEIYYARNFSSFTVYRKFACESRIVLMHVTIPHWVSLLLSSYARISETAISSWNSLRTVGYCIDDIFATIQKSFVVCSVTLVSLHFFYISLKYIERLLRISNIFYSLGFTLYLIIIYL